MMHRLLVFITPYRGTLTLSIGLGVLAVAGNLALLAVSAYLVATASLKPLLVTLSLPLYVVQAGGVVRAVARYAERLTGHDMTFRLVAHLRTWLFTCLLPLAPGRLLPYRSGDVLARLVTDLQEIEALYVRGLGPLAVAALVAMGTVAIVGAVSATLALATLLYLLLAGVGVPWLVYHLLRGVGEREVVLRATLHAHVLDGIQGLADLQACGAVAAHAATLTALEQQNEALRRRRAAITALHGGLLVALGGLASLTVFLLAAPAVGTGRLPSMIAAGLLLLVLGSIEAVAPVGTALAQLGRARAAATRLFNLVDSAPTVSDPSAPQHLPERAVLSLDGVSFRYAPDDRPALDSVTLTLRPGGRVAVVGSSGSGKSTLGRLVLRLYDPTAGELLFGEHRLRDYRLDDLRAAIALVPQTPYLFNDTMRHNLALGRPDASEAELQAALRLAALDRTVAAWPEGLETPLGAEGTRLSGGERQRLALARAVLMRPRILILDEATANLDPLTERTVLDNVAGGLPETAILLITHRLVALEAMDEIVVLDGGRVVERGRYADLAHAAGPFSALLVAQNSLFSTLSVATDV